MSRASGVGAAGPSIHSTGEFRSVSDLQPSAGSDLIGRRSNPSSASATPLPTCGQADEPAKPARYDDWALTLVDTTFRLPASY